MPRKQKESFRSAEFAQDSAKLEIHKSMKNKDLRIECEERSGKGVNGTALAFNNTP
jgi:hypothetical protein